MKNRLGVQIWCHARFHFGNRLRSRNLGQPQLYISEQLWGKLEIPLRGQFRRKNRLDEELGHQLYNQLWYDLDYQNNKKLSCNLQDTLRDKLSTQLWDHIRRPFWRIWSIRSEEAHEK